MIVALITAVAIAAASSIAALLLLLALLRQVRRYLILRDGRSRKWRPPLLTVIAVARQELIGGLPAVPSHRAPRGGSHA